MDWIKIMNNNGVKSSLKNAEQDTHPRKELEEIKRVVLHSAEELRREMNLRLLTEYESDAADPWQEYLVPTRVLYVDSITVTDIWYPDQ